MTRQQAVKVLQRRLSHLEAQISKEGPLQNAHVFRRREAAALDVAVTALRFLIALRMGRDPTSLR